MKLKRHRGLVYGVVGMLSLLVLPAASLANTEVAAGLKADNLAQLSVGYRGFSLEDEPGRAAEFRSLASSPFFTLRLFQDLGPVYLDLDGSYRGEDEHNLDLGVNARGQVRFGLRSDRFIHNLDHIPYASGIDGSRPDSSFGTDRGGQLIFYSDSDPGADYRLRLDFNEARLKIKAPNYPAHFNLSYWRYEKKGQTQLRFIDHGSASDCTSCHMQSRSRDMDRVTDEIKASVDAHAGYVDLALETLYREFRDREQTPVDYFRGRGRLAAGSYPHDETPDSTLKEVTLKVSTAPSGSLVGGASFTVGQRENHSDLALEGPIKAETDFTKATADLTYTPGDKWTYSLRYRRLDMDHDNSDRLSRYAGQEADFPAREAIDIERAWYEMVVNYQPRRSLTLKAELRTEDIERHGGDSEAWDLPEREVITRAKLGFQSRLLDRSVLKLGGWVAYLHSDDPAYRASPEDRTEFFLSAIYAPKGQWGFSASLSGLEEKNQSWYTELVSRAGVPFGYDLDRDHSQQKATLGGWLTPGGGLVFDLNYGYFRTAIDQDLLFGTAPDSDPALNKTVRDDDVEFRQTVHTLTAGATWQATQTLDCRIEAYHIRSKADFSPEFYRSGISYSNGIGDISSTALHEISRVDTTQNGVRARLNWQFHENWSCALEAGYDDYDQKADDLYDGSVQSALVSLAHSW